MENFYKSYLSIPKNIWVFKNFMPVEIACRGDGSILIDFDALNRLQKLREMMGLPLIINSAFRSADYNKKIGGSPKSQHLLGKAFDVSLKNLDREIFVENAKKCGFKGIGNYRSFVHIDTGFARTWTMMNI